MNITFFTALEPNQILLMHSQLPSCGVCVGGAHCRMAAAACIIRASTWLSKSAWAMPAEADVVGSSGTAADGVVVPAVVAACGADVDGAADPDEGEVDWLRKCPVIGAGRCEIARSASPREENVASAPPPRFRTTTASGAGQPARSRARRTPCSSQPSFRPHLSLTTTSRVSPAPVFRGRSMRVLLMAITTEDSHHTQRT